MLEIEKERNGVFEGERQNEREREGRERERDREREVALESLLLIVYLLPKYFFLPPPSLCSL